MEVELLIRFDSEEAKRLLWKLDLPDLQHFLNPVPSAAPPSITHQSHLADYLASPAFQAETQTTRLFLLVLAKLSALNPVGFFDLVDSESQKTQGRRFLGHSEEEVNSSGKSMQAKRVPDPEYDYWVETGSSTEKKKKHLVRWMTRLGFDKDDIRLATAAIGETRRRQG